MKHTGEKSEADMARLLLDAKTGILHLRGTLNKRTVQTLYRQWEKLNKKEIRRISLDELEDLDSSGVVLLDLMETQLSEREVSVGGLAPHLAATRETFSSRRLAAGKRPPRPGFFEKSGAAAHRFWQQAKEMLVLTSDIFFWSFIGLFNKKGQRKASVLQQSLLIGADAVGIIGLLSFILGLILALQSAAQLRQFGAGIYVADLLAVSLVREMGPMMTAILVAGRSGSSITAEIATMSVTEEIDALRMMAINPIRYVVVPKLHAISICMPLLVMLSIAMGILGGIVIGISYLSLSVTAYMNETILILTAEDLLVGFSKSLFFAWVIVILASYYGFRVKGGAEEVGKATTSSVVAAIFAVILLDALFSLFYMI